MATERPRSEGTTSISKTSKVMLLHVCLLKPIKTKLMIGAVVLLKNRKLHHQPAGVAVSLKENSMADSKPQTTSISKTSKVMLLHVCLLKPILVSFQDEVDDWSVIARRVIEKSKSRELERQQSADDLDKQDLAQNPTAFTDNDEASRDDHDGKLVESLLLSFFFNYRR